MSRILVVLGRIFYVAIFFMAVPGHFSAGTIGYAASHGVPMASFLVPASGVIAGLGALSILTGYKAKWGAWLIVLFLVPVTLTMHAFWAAPDAQAAQVQMVMFMKNLGLLGGALLLIHFGAGPYSLDARRHAAAS